MNTRRPGVLALVQAIQTTSHAGVSPRKTEPEIEIDQVVVAGKGGRTSAGIDWESSDPDSRARDGDEGATLERLGGIVEDGSERIVHEGRCHVRQAERHDAPYGVAAQGDNSPKVEIVGDDRPPFNLGLDNDLLVGEALQTLIAEVNSVVAEGPQKLGSGLGEAHVQEEPKHAVSVAGRN